MQKYGSHPDKVWLFDSHTQLFSSSVQMQTRRTPISSGIPSNRALEYGASAEDKTKITCEKLRSSLPSYDTLMSIVERNGAWWSSFYQKIHTDSHTAIKELKTFATQNYTSNNPVHIAILVVAFARSSGGNSHLYDLVDSLILSDRAYSATVDGLECLILLAKCYTDTGQPRKAWLLYHRGISNAQMMVRALLKTSLHLIDMYAGFRSTKATLCQSREALVEHLSR